MADWVWIDTADSEFIDTADAEWLEETAGEGLSIPIAMHHYTKNIGAR